MMEVPAGPFEMDRIKFQLPCDCICRGWLRGRKAKIKETTKSLAEEENGL